MPFESRGAYSLKYEIDNANISYFWLFNESDVSKEICGGAVIAHPAFSHRAGAGTCHGFPSGFCLSSGDGKPYPPRKGRLRLPACYSTKRALGGIGGS